MSGYSLHAYYIRYSLPIRNVFVSILVGTGTTRSWYLLRSTTKYSKDGTLTTCSTNVYYTYCTWYVSRVNTIKITITSTVDFKIPVLASTVLKALSATATVERRTTVVE
jgi:hypothetical protein